MNRDGRAGRAYELAAERRAPNQQPQRDADHDLEHDAAERHRELRGRGALREVVADPAAGEPEQPDVDDRPAVGERDRAVPDELVHHEANSGRREADPREKTSESGNRRWEHRAQSIRLGTAYLPRYDLAVTGRVLTVLLATAGIAVAAPKRKVRIETDPPGATVYLNAKEDGPVCTTPCNITVPVGDTPIIVELANHKQLFENLSVTGRKKITVKYKLEAAIGTINVKGPAGARITVDDVDQGKAPAKLEVPAGPHTVVLAVDGKPIATEFVDLAANDEIVIEPKGAQVGTRDEDVDVDDETGETGGGGAATGEITTRTNVGAPRTRGPYLKLGVAMDVGFRNFNYQGDDISTNLTPEKEGGQVLVGPVVEVYPGTLAGIGFLRGTSIYLRFGYGVNSQAVTRKGTGMTTSAKTFWRAFEASVRQRWPIKDVVAIEVGGGYVRDQYQFEGMVDDIKLVPDADYQSVRVGGRFSILTDRFEPYVAFENRIVLSGGALEKRFDEASATGLRAALGVEAKLGAFAVRVEGALNYYSWSFGFDSSMDEYRAESGTDSIKLITAAVGYAY